MKKIIPIFLLAGFILVSGQENTDSLQIVKRVKEYTILVENKKYDQVLEYISPKLFEVVKKETMLDFFEKTMNTQEFEITFDSFDIKSVSKPFQFDEDIYSNVETKSTITMKILNEELKENIGLFVAVMAEQFGDENVRYNEEAESVTMKKDSNMLAIQYQGNKIWYFITIDNKDQQALAQMIIPEQVIHHFYSFE